MKTKKTYLALLFICVFGILRSVPVYAVVYLSLHGADTGPAGNTSLISFNFRSNFRVLIPPGATYVNLSMNCQNQANVTTVARFGQAPSDYLPLPSSSSSSPKSLDLARTGNILSGNGDGILNITTKYFSTPLAENQAGWFYVDIIGDGVNHIDFDLSVNAAVYSEWYARTANKDCTCAEQGLCAMCGPITYSACSGSQYYCLSQYRNPNNSNECQTGQCQSYVTCQTGYVCPSAYQNPTNSSQCQQNQCTLFSCATNSYCPYSSCQSQSQCVSYTTCGTGQTCPSQYRNPANSSQCQQNQCVTAFACPSASYCPYDSCQTESQCLTYMTCPTGYACPSTYQNPSNPLQCQQDRCTSSFTCPANYYCPYASCQNQSQCVGYVTCSTGYVCPIQYQNPSNSVQCQPNQCISGFVCQTGTYCPSTSCLSQSQCLAYMTCPSGQVCPVQYQNPSDSTQCRQSQCVSSTFTCPSGFYCPTSSCQSIFQCMPGGTVTCSAGTYCPSGSCQSQSQCVAYVTCPTGQSCPAQYQNPVNSAQCQQNQCLAPITCQTGSYCPYTSCQSQSQCLSYGTCATNYTCPAQYQNPSNSAQCQQNQCVHIPYAPCSAGYYCPAQYRNPSNSSECQQGQCLSSCFHANDDLSLNICADYLGTKYGFLLNYSPNPHGLNGLFWKMNVGSFSQLQTDPGNCVSAGSDLTLNLCAEYLGTSYDMVLNFYPYPTAAAPSEYYWKFFSIKNH